jgi:hypothetical protein
MPLAGFDPAIPATKRSQTYALDRAVADVGHYPEYSTPLIRIPQFCAINYTVLVKLYSLDYKS